MGMLDKLKNFKLSSFKGSKSSSDNSTPNQPAQKNKAKEVKDEFNKLKMELSKLDKAKAYVDVKTLGRAYLCIIYLWMYR